MSYVGCFTLPFRDFSFVVKAQCEEEGTTGIRDSFVLATMISEDRFDLSEAEDGKIPGWWQNPYDSTVELPIMRNLSEDEQYDAQFPDHPLSRLRNILGQLQPVISVSQEVKNPAPFVYRELEQPADTTRPKKRWWKLQ